MWHFCLFSDEKTLHNTQTRLPLTSGANSSAAQVFVPSRAPVAADLHELISLSNILCGGVISPSAAGRGPTSPGPTGLGEDVCSPKRSRLVSPSVEIFDVLQSQFTHLVIIVWMILYIDRYIVSVQAGIGCVGGFSSKSNSEGQRGSCSLDSAFGPGPVETCSI